MIRGALIALAASMLLACTAPGPVPPEDDPAALLDALVDEWLARELRADGAGTPADMARAGFEGRIQRDRELLERLQGIDPLSLGLPQQVDRATLMGLLGADVDLAERRRRWATDPGQYLAAARLNDADAPDAAAAERAGRLAMRLARVPGLLQNARDNLERPPLRFTEAALFQVLATIAELDERVPPLTESAGEAGVALATAYARARPDLEAYAAFLRDDVLPRSDGDWALGREGYDAMLQLRWWMQDDADSILRRGYDAFEATEAEAQAVAERIDADADWVAVYESLKDDHPPAAGIRDAYQAQMDSARAFVREHRVVSLPDGERVVTIDTPPAMRRSSPFGTFQTVGPFDDELLGRLVLTPVEDWLSPEQRRERLRSHHTSWIPIIAVHEAYPGHHVQAIKANENARPLRHVVRESIFSEGWGLYTEQLMLDLGFLTGDDVHLTMLRNRLWRAARVILDVSLHTGRMTIDEAVDFLVERVRFERYAAELEVDMYTRRPGYVLGYLIGMQEIAAIRDEWVRRNGIPEPPSELWDQLLVLGALPPALVRAELFGEPLPPQAME